MILTSFILPFFSDPKYSILENSLSELGAQNTPYNWLMNLVFIALIGVTFITGYRVLKGFHFHVLLLLIFSISFFMTAIYQHAPVNRSIPFNSFENEIHSIFSTLTGISFCLYSIFIGIISEKKKHRRLAILIGFAALILSYSMFIHSDFRGIYQRAIFISAFGWLLYSFKYYTFTIPDKSILNL